MELFFVALVLLGVYLYVQNLRLRRKYPPGPRAWPIVGNLRELARGQHRVFAEWRLKYGDVFTVWLGPRPAVVLSGQEAVKEALQKHGDVFSSRPDLFLYRLSLSLSLCHTHRHTHTHAHTQWISDKRHRKKKDIKITDRDLIKSWDRPVKIICSARAGLTAAAYGPEWKETRKVALTWLNSFGAGKLSLEPTIVQEAQDLVQVFKDKCGQPFDPTVSLSLAVANVICSLVFGRRFDHSDERFSRLVELQNRYFRANAFAQALNVYPTLRHVPSFRRKLEEVLTCSEEIRSFVIEVIQEHRETFDPNNIRDVIDGFLLEEHRGNRILSDLPQDNIINVIRNLFVAGTDTTATTLRWALLYLVMNPDVQRKVQEEIDVSLGKQTPSMQLREHLPYTEATIREALRIRTISPSSVPHETTAPATVLGHQIPAGTFIIPNLWSLHMDPKYWPDPERFDPTRFLDSDGQLSQRTESFLPFGTGPRRCLGDQLAKFELFLFFTSMLQQFTFKLPEGAPTPDTEGIFGLVFTPKPFEICALPQFCLTAAAYGPEWKETRKVALTWLNTFGAGKLSLEPTIVQEAQDLVQVFKDKCGQPVDPTVSLSLAVANVICSLVFGRRFDHSDERFSSLVELQNRYFRANASAQALNVYPILRHVPSFRRKLEEVLTCSDKIRSFVIEVIQEHRETFDPNNIRDVIDGFLLEEHQGNRILSELPHDNTINVIRNLFVAGTDTTATTLRWALLYLVMNPEVQRKVQEEVDVSLGKQTPSTLLREHLPYTEATIREAQRIRPIAPSSVPHETTAPATIMGHQIPAGTFIIPNLWSLHMDPKCWPDPERFDPTRFLDANGQLKTSVESFLPFCTGPRRCLGEQLAKFELFLFFTSMLQQFTFKLPEGAPTPDTEGIFGLVFSPQPFKICAFPRF
ncbi:cytochrome P450 2D15-like [Branchiostoma floridae x Branchiostoma japonicum]